MLRIAIGPKNETIALADKPKRFVAHIFEHGELFKTIHASSADMMAMQAEVWTAHKQFTAKFYCDGKRFNP